MFDNLDALDSRRHGDLTYHPVADYRFAQQVTSAPLAISECQQAARCFPVVFAKGDTGVSPVALLSMRKGDNPFVDSEGQWRADYLPAHLRRYPFILGETDEQGRFWVMIDRQAPHFEGDEGEPLFVDGQEPENGVVQRAKTFLVNFEKELRQTRELLKPLDTHGVLVERQFTVNQAGKQEVAVRGFYMVDEEKLKALDDATLAKWVRSGLMGLITGHLQSLDNANRVLRLQQRETAAVD
ncbi:MAG: SapC family protein [Pseudomonadota bacterium]